MLTLKDYVNWGITHSDKTGSAEGVPLVMEKCVKNKRMKQFEVYGNSVQNGTPSPEAPVEVESVGELVTDTTDTNYGKYKVPVVVRGKNVVDIKQLVGGALADNNDGTYTLTRNSSGSRISKVMALSLPAGTKVYVRANTLSENGTNSNRVSWLINYVDGSQKTGNVFGFGVTYGIEMEKETKSFGLYIQYSTDADAYHIFNNLIVAVDAAPSEYEPYVEPQTTNVYLNEPLRKIGDYADVLDFKDKKVVRNTKEKIFDGSEDWNHESLSVSDKCNNFYTKIHEAYGDSNTKVLCNMGHHNGSSLTSNYSCRISQSKNFNFRYQAYDNVADFKAKLTEMYNNNNPMILDYVIETPYEEPIECDIPTLTAKTSIVEIDTALLPSNIKGKYIKK